MLRETYYLCQFMLLTKENHTHYHHVIIKTANPNKITDINAETYQYYLRSILPLDLEEKDKQKLVYRGLIRDGESLWKRMQKAKSKNKKVNESC